MLPAVLAPSTVICLAAVILPPKVTLTPRPLGCPLFQFVQVDHVPLPSTSHDDTTVGRLTICPSASHAARVSMKGVSVPSGSAPGVFHRSIVEAPPKMLARVRFAACAAVI